MPAPIVAPLTTYLKESLTATGVWTENSPIALDRLALISIPYFDFDGAEHNDGELIVLDAVAEQAAAIFFQLYKNRFPLAKIRSAHHYGASDELSMEDNNSSCFCVRPIEGTDLTSLHSYGLAIDINPLQNPFVMFDEKTGNAKIYPKNGWEYLNRHNQKEGMVETIVPLLAEHGFFIWGGKWTTPIDYHHFQPQRGIAELLSILPCEDGKRFIRSAIKERDSLTTLTSMPSGSQLTPLLDLYVKNKTDFFDKWFVLSRQIS